MKTPLNISKIAKGVNAILAGAAPVNATALLFGSRARGDAREDSDWDLLVLLDKERLSATDMDEISYPIRELGWEFGENVNPVMFTLRDWQRKRGTPFYENVMAEGIAI